MDHMRGCVLFILVQPEPRSVLRTLALNAYRVLGRCFFPLFVVALGLCCCMQAFSHGGELGLLFAVVLGLLIVGAPRACGLQQVRLSG